MYYNTMPLYAILLGYITIYVIFKSKKQLNKLHNKLFKLMVINYIFLTLTEIIPIIYYFKTINCEISNLIVRFHWMATAPQLIIAYHYLILMVDSKIETTKEIYEKVKYSKYITYFLGVSAIAYLFMPFNVFEKNNINFILIPQILFLGFQILILVTSILFYKKENKIQSQKSSIMMMLAIEIIIIGTIQVKFKEIPLFTLPTLLLLIFFYLTRENPDIEIKKTSIALKEQIDFSSKAKTNIILNMSHDIRSPLNAIVNYSNELATIENIKDEILNEDINNILTGSKNLLRILDDILEATNQSLVIEETYNIYEMILDSIGVTKARLIDKEISLEMNLNQNMPAFLIGNAAKIYRILINILSNSAKYTEVGKIILDVKYDLIDKENLMLKIKVSDTGFGIKDEDKPKVFSEFGRLKDATSQNIEGTGLGLINTKQNIEKLGGKIWFDSCYGAGTTFYINIPQKFNNPTPISIISKQINNKLETNTIDCSGLSVLLVDDDNLGSEITIRLLQKYNFTIYHLKDGNETLKVMKNGYKFNMIFIESSLNFPTAEELVKNLRDLEKLDSEYKMPILIELTSNTLTEMKSKYKEIGYDDMIEKPIEIQKLNKLISKYKK